MRYIVVDLAVTCWESGMSRGHSETIEVGAVKLAGSGGRVMSTFSTVIRPTAFPELSEHCTELTGITQDEVDAAEPFPDALARLVDWVGAEEFQLCTWGQSELAQLQVDARRHKLTLPEGFQRHIHLKREFSRCFDTKPVGVSGALAKLKLPEPEPGGRCLGAARTLARIAPRILQKLEADAAAAEKA